MLFFDTNKKRISRLEEAIASFVEKNEKGFAELRAAFQETDRKFQDTDKEINKLTKKSSEFDSNWGKLIEAMVQPQTLELFQERGINVSVTSNNIYIEREKKKVFEIDLFLRNGDSVILVEVKTTLRVENVNDHIEKRLLRFKDFFPEYKDKKIYGAVAFLKSLEGADHYAIKNGLFALTLSGKNLIVIKNKPDYEPKDFR